MLTEKIARRGYHLSREYDVDPLEVLLADEVMHAEPATSRITDRLPLPASVTGSVVPRPRGSTSEVAPLQRLFPVVDTAGGFVGAVPRRDLVDPPAGAATVESLLVAEPLVVRADDTLRAVASRFAHAGVSAAPVLHREDPTRLAGLVTAEHLLDGRLRDLAEEHHRERPLGPRQWPISTRAAVALAFVHRLRDRQVRVRR